MLVCRRPLQFQQVTKSTSKPGLHQVSLLGPAPSQRHFLTSHPCLQDNEGEDTDGEAASQADSFVVADGYLSESERMDLEDIVAAVGGKRPLCDATLPACITIKLQIGKPAQAASRLL